MKKFIKLGVVFASVTILSGVVAPVGGGLLNTNSVAYAQENDTRNIYVEAYTMEEYCSIIQKISLWDNQNNM